ncbi:DUF5602 domain-containing protein [Prescottella defluvii]|nr:DUF5602 domain-containing protein [Prescottella defluvii]
MGNGTSRTYVVRDEAGQPTEVGIRMSETALDGLPDGPDATTQMSMLALPAGASDTGFDHVMHDWNPHGHDPVALFGEPHFDMHFYMDAVQHDIDPTAPDFAQKAGTLPEAKYVPPGYAPPPGPAEANAVPFMGLHWTDAADNAVPGAFDFTEVLLNGSWDGKFAVHRTDDDPGMAADAHRLAGGGQAAAVLSAHRVLPDRLLRPLRRVRTGVCHRARRMTMRQAS